MSITDYNFNLFYAAQSMLSSAAPTPLNGEAIYRFAPEYSSTHIPLHIRTGAQSFGSPSERKRFKQVEFHGTGTLYVRAYVDGVWISDGTVTLTENPSKDRKFSLPIGTKGYTLDLEFCGDADPRIITYEISPMAAPS
jgi:hypothetical protein